MLAIEFLKEFNWWYCCSNQRSSVNNKLLANAHKRYNLRLYIVVHKTLSMMLELCFFGIGEQCQLHHDNEGMGYDLQEGNSLGVRLLLKVSNPWLEI